MVAPDATLPQAMVSKGADLDCSPRISFSAEGLEDFNELSSINLLSNKVMKEEDKDKTNVFTRSPDFEFLSNDHSGSDVITADELFYEGKLLPFWQAHNSETLKKLSLKTREAGEEAKTHGVVTKEEIHKMGNWFVDDDPSPRPPSCTMIWKELLRLKKKQRASTLSPSSSSSSSSSGSLDLSTIKEENAGNNGNNSKTARKPLERTKSSTMSRIRPMVNVPICKTQGGRISSLPPLRKPRLDK